jgi:cell shape-determining protein MreD
MVSYWPQASIGLGLLLGLAAAVAEDGQLGVAATNFVTIGAAFALQRRRNDRSDDE